MRRLRPSKQDLSFLTLALNIASSLINRCPVNRDDTSGLPCASTTLLSPNHRQKFLMPSSLQWIGFPLLFSAGRSVPSTINVVVPGFSGVVATSRPSKGWLPSRL